MGKKILIQIPLTLYYIYYLVLMKRPLASRAGPTL